MFMSRFQCESWASFSHPHNVIIRCWVFFSGSDGSAVHCPGMLCEGRRLALKSFLALVREGKRKREWSEGVMAVEWCVTADVDRSRWRISRAGVWCGRDLWSVCAHARAVVDKVDILLIAACCGEALWMHWELQLLEFNYFIFFWTQGLPSSTEDRNKRIYWIGCEPQVKSGCEDVYILKEEARESKGKIGLQAWISCDSGLSLCFRPTLTCFVSDIVLSPSTCIALGPLIFIAIIGHCVLADLWIYQRIFHTPFGERIIYGTSYP